MGMYTTKDPIEVNLVSTKRRRKGSRKKMPDALPNGGQAQKLPEEGCPTRSDQIDTNAFSMTKGEVQHQRSCGIAQTCMEKTKDPVEVNLVRKKGLRKGIQKKMRPIVGEEFFLIKRTEHTDMETTKDPMEVDLVSKKESQKKLYPILELEGFPITRIEQTSMVTTKDPIQVNFVSTKRRRKGRQKKMPNALQNSGQAQKLLEDGCPTRSDQMNTIAFSVSMSEVQDTILEVDLTPCPPFARIELIGMETIKSGQDQKLPEEGCPTSINHKNTNSFSMTQSGTILEADSSGQAENLSEEGCSTSTNHMNTNSFSKTNSEVLDTILVEDSNGQAQVADQVPSDQSKTAITLSHSGTTRCGSGISAQKLPDKGYLSSTNHMNTNSDSTLYPPCERIKQTDMETTEHPLEENLPEQGCQPCTNNPNIDSFSVSMSEVQDTILEVDLTACPPFARIEQTGMETIKSPVEVNLVGKKKTGVSQKKPKALQNNGQAQQLPKDGCLTVTSCMNIMSTLSVSDEKKSEEQVISSGADETKQVSFAVVNEKDSSSEVSHSSLVRAPADHLRKKLLILDINGLLADISSPPKNYKANLYTGILEIFKRPFCRDFLDFCFERFEVGVWTSRIKKNADKAIDHLMGDKKHKLLICWDQSHCTATSFKCPENNHKPVVFKELRKIWENDDPNLPWEKGDYNESNTLLLDDSPYKALLNPPHSAVFPYSYIIGPKRDNSLGPGGDIRVYLEGLAVAENTQKYVKQNPFGQKAITKESEYWDLYRRAVDSVKSSLLE